MRTSPSWIPVRDGETYCSLACGAGCTFAAYQEAKLEAAALAQRLSVYTGRTWRPRVWENLGWHYEAQLEGVDSVQVFGAEDSWTCIANIHPLSTVNHASTPERAFLDTQEEIRSIVSRLDAATAKI